MKETIGNSHYQEKVSCLIEFAVTKVEQIEGILDK